MTHKEINELEDENLQKIMRLIKRLDTNQKKLQKIINKNRDERDSI
jgi:hypothetical protein